MVVVVSPTTLPEPPAFEAATIAGEIADVDLAAENVPRHGAADQRRGDVVEEARQHEHDDEQHEAALPVVGQEGRHLVGHAALLEMPRQQRKAHQQQEQVREDHPFVLQVQRRGPARPAPNLKPVKTSL